MDYDRILQLRCFANQRVDVTEMLEPHLCFAVDKTNVRAHRKVYRVCQS